MAVGDLMKSMDRHRYQTKAQASGSQNMAGCYTGSVEGPVLHNAFAGKNKSEWPRELCVCWKNYFRKKQIRVGANCFCIVTLSLVRLCLLWIGSA